MAHFLGTCNRKPNASQKSIMKKGLREIDPDLVLAIGATPGEQPMYVEAPDNYAASHMAEKARAVTDLVRKVMCA